jgi:hypothetical protein
MVKLRGVLAQAAQGRLSDRRSNRESLELRLRTFTSNLWHNDVNSVCLAAASPATTSLIKAVRPVILRLDESVVGRGGYPWPRDDDVESTHLALSPTRERESTLKAVETLLQTPRHA